MKLTAIALDWRHVITQRDSWQSGSPLQAEKGLSVGGLKSGGATNFI
jgi:hypothetical protein